MCNGLETNRSGLQASALVVFTGSSVAHMVEHTLTWIALIWKTKILLENLENSCLGFVVPMLGSLRLFLKIAERGLDTVLFFPFLPSFFFFFKSEFFA